jgi:hypothetical protein
MSDIKIGYSDYEKYVLKSDYAESLILRQEPEGWNDDSIELVRHKEYHGIFTSFTNALTFRTDAKDYIEQAYVLGGVNADLRLTKYILKEVNNEVKWAIDYTGIADFKTKGVKDGGLSVNFTSNELEEIIKSHQSDTFEIERKDSINASTGQEDIGEMELFKTQLKGRDIIGSSLSVLELENIDQSEPWFNTLEVTWDNKQAQVGWMSWFDYTGWTSKAMSTPITKLISRGNDRFVTVDRASTFTTNGVKTSASNMFYVREETGGSVFDTLVIVDYKIELDAISPFGGNTNFKAFIVVLEWNEDINNEDYTLISFDEIYDGTSTDSFSRHSFSGKRTIQALTYKQGIAITFQTVSGTLAKGYYTKFDLSVRTDEFYEPSNDITFTFVHDVADRLMQIITGKSNMFYSKYFGRTELGYAEDGYGGLIGLICGFWARAFDPQTDEYKSLQISLKELIKSLQAVFNIGIAVETNNLTQKLRFEELKYFYRQEIVIKLPNQVNNVSRKVDANLFFSGTDIGYEYGGDYENEVGLDEPNTRTETVTPIRKSDKKYTQVSKIRSDDYGLEIIRRKPQSEANQEDTSQDEHNWFLDMKRIDEGVVTYEQRIWSDKDADDNSTRLTTIPTGIDGSENYKGMIFTPLRMLFRHGWILRSGLEPYYNKLIKYANTDSNKNLTMQFVGEDAYSESDDIPVSALDRSRFLPETIEFEHPVNDALLDLIRGTTIVDGEKVPNVYFKFEWVNEYEEKETGYLLELKPKGNGKFKFQKANENLIRY